MSSEHLINSLADAVRALVRTQEAATKEMAQFVAPIQALPPLLTKQIDVLERRFVEQMQQMAQLELIRSQADQEIHDRMVKTAESTIEEALSEFEKDVAEVGERVARLQLELNEDVRTRVRRLDATAFELLEGDLENSVTACHRDLAVPRDEILTSALSDGFAGRDVELDDYAKRIAAMAQKYVNDRKTFWAWLKGRLVSGNPAHASVPVVGIPVYFVEERDADGGRRRQFHLAPSAASQKGAIAEANFAPPSLLQALHRELSESNGESETSGYDLLLETALLRDCSRDAAAPFVGDVARLLEGQCSAAFVHEVRSGSITVVSDR
jgi:hypothetical protein